MLLLLAGASACLPGLPEAPAGGEAPAGPDGADTVSHAGGYPSELAPLETGRRCFTHHLREAISLNERRAPVYGRLSDGASAAVSRRLIRIEQLALLAAAEVDRQARPYQEAGIPIACGEFVSMAMTPTLEGREAPPAERFNPRVEPGPLEAELRQAYAMGGFAGVASVADSAIDSLGPAPSYHCMTRHILESIWRVAELAPYHAAAARRADLPSTRPLSELLLRLHLATLAEAAELDRLAAPLQEQGIPIICRDVPPLRAKTAQQRLKLRPRQNR